VKELNRTAGKHKNFFL